MKKEAPLITTAELRAIPLGGAIMRAIPPDGAGRALSVSSLASYVRKVHPRKDGGNLVVNIDWISSTITATVVPPINL